MNIAFLGYSKPHTRYNGVATVILQQTQWLEEHGHIVLHYHLFSKEEYKNLSAFLIENKVDLAIWHMTSFKIHLHHKLPCPLICLFHQNPIVKNPKYASTFIEKYQISAFLKKIFEVKFIGNALSYAHYIYCKLFFIYVTAIADKMVLLSSRYVSQFIPAKLFPKKVTAIPNASDMTFLDVRCEKEKNVVFVGRLNNEHKGVDMLLRIWKKVEDRYEDWKLILCGDGPDGESLKNDALCLNLQRVYFQGFTPPEKLKNTLVNHLYYV